MVSLRRYCCRQLMRCYRDSDALTEVTWYWVPEDRPWVDVPHVFYDRTWQLMSEPPSAVGEQLARPPYYLGRAPVDADGTHFCGTPAAWRGEASIHDPPLVLSPDTGLPVCCGPQARPLVAGVAIGGELVQLPAESVGGGVALGGELVQVLRLDGVAIGGDLERWQIVTGCDAFPVSAAQWRVPPIAVSNNGCTDCANLNQPATLIYAPAIGQPCRWGGAVGPLCGQLRAMLLFLSGGVWVLQTTTGTASPAQWQLAGTSWDPLGPNTLTLTLNGTDCSGWPATITVEPVIDG